MSLHSHFEFITTPGYSVFKSNPSIFWWPGKYLVRITEKSNYSTANKIQESKIVSSYNSTVNPVVTSRSLKVSDLQVL